MIMDTYKFRLYPTEDQKILLRKHFGCVRFVYNWALEFNQKLYASGQKYKNYIAINCDGDLYRLKDEHEWLKEVNSQSLVSSIGHLDRAYTNFFKGYASFPKFKKKGHSTNSFEVPQHFQIDFKKSSIQIPKFCKDNQLKVRIHRHVNMDGFVKFGRATISENSGGQFFVSFLVYRNGELPKTVSESAIDTTNSLGFDFGLKHFLTLSDGRKFDNPEFFRRAFEKIQCESRRLSRKAKGSKNHERQRLKLAKAYLKISNQRSDFLHKLSSNLVKESQFDCFCFEDLNLEGMKKRWGRKVSDLSFQEFVGMMEYKCAREGKRFAKIGRFDPSSQICSKCGHRQKMPLSERVYVCPECGLEIDRDVNAAVNIRNFGIMRILKKSKEDNHAICTAGTAGINDCGDGGSGRGDKRCGETAVGEAVKVPRGRKSIAEADALYGRR